MDTSQEIQFYSVCFYVFLGIAILGFTLAIFFFFFYDIPSIFARMTGWEQKKAIERMEKQKVSGGLIGGLTGNRGKTEGIGIAETAVLPLKRDKSFEKGRRHG